MYPAPPTPVRPPNPADGVAIRIALCLNRVYTPWAATTIASCLGANPECSIRFEIVHDCTLSKGDLDGLQQIVDRRPAASIDFHPVSPSSGLSELPTTHEFGSVVWLRLYLPEILVGVSKVLYLDADTFVVGQLTYFWDSPLGDAPLAAVANVVEPPFRSHVAALGIKYPGGYFNSGVLLLNLERMRAEDTLDRLRRFALDHRHELIWPDQDVLNSVFIDRWLPLHPRFNSQSCLWHWGDWAVEVFGEHAVREAKRAPVIRHFEGRGLCKPWHYMCPVPGYKEYRRVLATTPWANTPIEDRTAVTRVIRLLPGDFQLRAYRRLERWRTVRTGAS